VTGEGRKAPLTALLAGAAAGRYPPADGRVTILPAASPRDAGVIGFSAHAVIFIDADPAWVAAQLPPDDLSGPLSPAFLQALCQRTNRQAHTIDMLCVATPLDRPPQIPLEPVPGLPHPRITRALRYRDEVRAWRTDGGVMVLGRGIAGSLLIIATSLLVFLIFQRNFVKALLQGAIR